MGTSTDGPTIRRIAALANLTRESPRKNELSWAALTGITVFLVTFVRDPSAWRTLWAEDGKVFLAGAVEKGFGSYFHFDGGYLHFDAQTGALIASIFPLSIAPVVIATYAVAITSICGATVEAFSGAYIEARWIRVGLGLCFGLLPAIRFESIANITNLQVFLVPTAFWVLLVIPRTKAGRVMSVVLLVATAASTIVGFLLFPLALLRLLNRRNRLPAAAFLATQSLHGIVILIARPSRHLVTGTPPSSVASHFLYDVVASQFFGGQFDDLQHKHLTVLVIGVVVTASVVLLLVNRPYGARDQLIVAVGALVLGCVSYLSEALTDGPTARYAALAAFFILFGVGVVADVASRLKVARPIAAVVALAVVLSWGFSFPVSSYRDTGPRWSNAYADAQRACHGTTKLVQVPILPISWGGVPAWSMTLPCSAIH